MAKIDVISRKGYSVMIDLLHALDIHPGQAQTGKASDGCEQLETTSRAIDW
jgi:hypothetical protein